MPESFEENTRDSADPVKPAKQPSKFTRRGFLRGVGAAGLVTGATGVASLFADSGRVEAANASPPFSLHVDSVTTPVPFRIFYPDDPLTFEVVVSGPGAAKLQNQVRVVVRHMRNYASSDKSNQANWKPMYGYNRPEEEVGNGVATVVRDGANTTLKCSLDLKRLGAFRILAVVDDREEDLADFLRIQPPNDVPADTSYYAVDGMDRNSYEKFARAGVKVIRLSSAIRYKDSAKTAFDFADTIRTRDAMNKFGLKGFSIIGSDDPSFWSRVPGGASNLWYAPGKCDTTPQPHRLPEFGRWCGELATVMKGTVRGYEFFNEPWELGSISGMDSGGAQIRRLLAAGAPAIKKSDPNAKILAGCSIANEEDSFLPYQETMDLLDVLSTHTYYNWDDWANCIARKVGKEVWDTESWCSTTEDFNPSKFAHMIWDGYRLIEPLGAGMDLTGDIPWTSGTSTFLTSQRFLDGMTGAGTAMKGKLPTILLFEGRGRAVAFLQSISPNGPDAPPGPVPYRQQDPDWLNPEYKSPGAFVFSAPDPVEVFDVWGNKLERNGQDYRVPVGRFGYYITAPNLAVLKQTLLAGQLEGISPFYIKIHDIASRVKPGATLRISLTNVYPSEERATITVDGGKALQLETPSQDIMFNPGEEKTIEFVLRDAKPQLINRYRVNVEAKGLHGISRYEEEINAAVIVKGTPKIDGDLSDWDAFNPVPVYLSAQPEYTNETAKYMKLPFVEMSQKDAEVYCVQAQCAWDENYFYFGAKINDLTEDRRESNAFGKRYDSNNWPNQYIYLGRPQLPGVSGDCILLSFNTNDDNKRLWDFMDPEDPLYRVNAWPDTDYEFEVYPVAYNAERDALYHQAFGTKRDPKTGQDVPAWPGYPESEVWRLYDPKMIWRHHAYPFNLKMTDYDQDLVPGAMSAVKRNGNTWTYECAIPWSQIWEAKALAGGKLRFTFYTRNDGGHALEYAAGKSVSFQNCITFHPMWEWNWSNDCDWGFEV